MIVFTVTEKEHTISYFLGLVVRQIPWSYSIVYDENRKRWKQVGESIRVELTMLFYL